jgi:hypothetical protein
MAFSLMLLGASGGGVFDYWAATLSGPSNRPDLAFSLAVSDSNDVYFAGRTDSEGPSEDRNGVIGKFNSNGRIEWQRNLSGTGDEYFVDILLDSQENVYATYQTRTGVSYPHIGIAKYDSDGNLQWQRKYGGSSFTDGYAATIDSSGNIYIAGSTRIDSFDFNDYLMMKFNSDGDIQWQRLEGDSGSSEIYYGMALDQAGNLYGLGRDFYQTDGNNFLGAVIVKYDNDGNVLWRKSLRHDGYSYFWGGHCDALGNIYAVGHTNATGSSSQQDAWIVKFDNDGNVLWQRTLVASNTNSDIYKSVTTDSLGNVYATGQLDNKLIIAKYDSDGNLQWQRSDDQGIISNGNEIQIDSEDNIYIAGEIYSVDSNTSILVFKVPNDGSLTGTYQIGTSSFDYQVSSFVDQATTLAAVSITLSSKAATLTTSLSTIIDQESTLSAQVTEIG